MAKHIPESRTVLITGLANSGKTQLFNNLTGDYGVVANYPMTTIEQSSGHFTYRNINWELIDSPGINTLTADSSEAIVFRKTFLEQRPDMLLQCIDANRLKQSLRLTAELLELQVPLVISLNVIDETAKKGIRIDPDMLSRLLGLPVVETVASEGVGMYDLKESLQQARVSSSFAYTGDLKSAVDSMEQEIPEDFPYRRKAAVLALMGDLQLEEIEFGHAELKLPEDRISSIREARRTILLSCKGDFRTLLSRQMAAWTDSTYDRIVTKRPEAADNGIAVRLAYYSRHPVFGLLFLAVFLAVSYLGVVLLAGWVAGLMEAYITEPLVELIGSGISSQFLHDLLIGDFGILTLGLFNAICTILPILSVFFFIFGFLEDVGYLPNLSVLLRRSFTKIGLSGRAVMPIILGFGCKTMATLTTRSLKSRKERLIAIYLIAFAIPCSAQLALNIAILGKAGVLPFIIAVVFLVIVEIIAGKVLNSVIKDDGNRFFIQELPPFRAPSLQAVLKKTGYRLLWFLKEAIPVFMIAAAVIFFIDHIGVLDFLKMLLRPLVVQWLGLPIEMVEALILLIAREEAAAGLILRLSDMGMLNAVQSIIAVVVTTMFVPCFANIVAMFKEAGAKAGILMLIGINVSTILLAGILNWLLLTLGMPL